MSPIYQFGARWEFNHVLGDLLIVVESHQVGLVVTKDARFVGRLAQSFHEDFAVFELKEKMRDFAQFSS